MVCAAEIMEPQVTRVLLQAWKSGDRSALDQLTEHLHGELRRLAASYMRRERADHTLAPTALVNEAYLQFAQLGNLDWKDRAHFLGIAAHLMRQILVQHARGKRAQKRGGGNELVPLQEELIEVEGAARGIIALDDALEALAAHDPERARLIEMRHFGGLSNEELAEATGQSLSTVGRQLRLAYAFLHRELAQ